MTIWILASHLASNTKCKNILDGKPLPARYANASTISLGESHMIRLTMILSFLFSVNAWSQCPSNTALKAQGFKIHTRNFQKYFNKAEKWLNQNKEQFRDDLSGTIYSSVASQMVVIESFDYLLTPQTEMFGDVVFMETFRGKEPVEVRWYENGKKNLAYNTKIQNCATNTIPFAINALL